jgi:hypothetical protein
MPQAYVKTSLTGGGFTEIIATGTRPRLEEKILGRGDRYKVKRIAMRHQHNAVEEITRTTQRLVREKMPRRSGRSQNQVRRTVFRSGDHVFGVVSADDMVVRILESGSGIYGPNRRRIRPHGKFLRFPHRGGGGFRLDDVPRQFRGGIDPRARYVFTRSVRGQRGHHMFRRTATEMRRISPTIYKTHCRLAVREIKARV